jgi:ABC-2 type transport system permease protein
MTPMRHALLVAGWEFRRYFKWRDQVIGFVVSLAIAAAAYAAGRVATSSGGRTMTVGIDGVEPAVLSALLAPDARLRIVPAPAAPLREAALRDGDLHGILIRRAEGAFELQVDKDPRYLPALRALVNDLVRRERLSSLGVNMVELQKALAPADLQVQFLDPERGRTGRGEQLVAAISIGFVMIALFTGMALLLTGITGEKQLRVTESIVSIVPPQAWIDGKIVGIGAYALVSMVGMIVSGLIVTFAAQAAWQFTVPSAAVRPGIAVLLIVFSMLGLLLWNAFFAAFAATIDDPNTSARSSFMFVPVIFVGVACWTVLRDPDSTASRVLALFPLTSAAALPVRAILSNVGAVEIVTAIALLVGAIWLSRRAAGRIFEVGMLMYGKEPRLREMMRWLRAP